MTDIEQTQQVEEVSPLDMIASLEGDLKKARVALRRIMSADPTEMSGPSNRRFGKRFIYGYYGLQQLAAKAYYSMENDVKE